MAQTLHTLRSKQPAGFSFDPFDKEFALNLDKQDSLATYRDLFHIPRIVAGDESSPETIYFCGNSLGLQPKPLQGYLNKELKAWQDLGVEGHFKKDNPWLTVEDPLIEPLAHLVGAKPVEVAPMNSLTMDLHVLLIHFYKPTKDRFKIIMEGDAFPSDEHAIEAQARFHGLDPAKAIVQLKPREGEYILRTEDVKAAIDREGASLALVILSGLQFYTGQLFEMEKITKYGHDVGAVVGWDLAHATGNVPLKLHDWNVDFACWCSYKYLNSGPGAIAGIFVHEKHAIPPAQEGGWSPRLAGWFGHELDTRFKTGIPFKPMPGALGFRCSNPSVLCITSLRCSLDIFERAGIQNLREKSFLLTGYLELLVDQQLNSSTTAVTVITPRDPEQRGCQLSFLVKKGGDFDVDVLHKKLAEKGVICDVRQPNVIRIAPIPLYNTFDEVRRFIVILKELLNATK
eukprot:Phypoly_transcript_09444.p1 GENE.Phypoly_transcript_09444~~Phypoly_transcript_09444.p1  ORF type:complete len:457 (+),score=52.92 Phypoly_transcript_09444:33-1403(+)